MLCTMLETMISMIQSQKRFVNIIVSCKLFLNIQVPLVNFTFNLPLITLYNSEVNVGLDLEIEENLNDGKFTLRYSFPEKWYPNLLGYNR